MMKQSAFRGMILDGLDDVYRNEDVYPNHCFVSRDRYEYMENKNFFEKLTDYRYMRYGYIGMNCWASGADCIDDNSAILMSEPAFKEAFFGNYSEPKDL